MQIKEEITAALIKHLKNNKTSIFQSMRNLVKDIIRSKCRVIKAFNKKKEIRINGSIKSLKRKSLENIGKIVFF